MTLHSLSDLDAAVFKPAAEEWARRDTARWARLTRFQLRANNLRSELTRALEFYPRSPLIRKRIRETCMAIRGLESVRRAAEWRELYQAQSAELRIARQALAAARWR